MARACSRLLWRLILVSSVWFAFDSPTKADAYYTVTDIGPDVNGYDMNGQTVTNPQTGVSYPFVVTTTPTSTVDTQNLPGVNGLYGVESPQNVFFPMTVLATNSLGTVLGGVPDGSSRAEPYSYLTYGYAVPTTNGQYSGFIPLSSSGYYEPQLSQANEILYNAAYAPTTLVNVSTGVSTPVDQLVPPAFLQQYYGIAYGVAIDDRGDILVETGPGQPELFILTPPGLAAPTAAPEPSTLLIFGLISAGMGLRSAMQRRSA
jgi:hypothetical protein